jgi:hypothetical protein
MSNLKIGKYILLRVIIIVFAFFLVVFIILYLNNLIDRRADIKLGNKIIQSIGNYQTIYKKLPDENDLETLKKLSFDTTEYFIRPEYYKINDSVYQLAFVAGFDPPYLIWISNDKKWKMDFPIYPDKWLEKKK